MRRRARARPIIAAWIVTVLVIIVLVGGCVYKRSIETSTATFTVTDKTASGGGTHNGHKYLIFTNHGTFEDTDNIWHAKFASSDLYAQIRIGHTYTCKTTGFRIPLFSAYRNLISCREVQ